MNAPKTPESPPLPLWFRWAQLVRLPTVFTVIAQVAAAFLIAAGSSAAALAAWPRGGLILLAAIAIYWAGMIFNDLWDLAEDRRERPSRPLPSGAIGLSAARTAAWGLLLAGIALATLAGVVSRGESPITFAPPVIASALVLGVLLYNGPFKPTAFAPLMMGTCRLLCFLLGAAPLMIVGTAEFVHPQIWFPIHVWALAAGFGVYITGITTVSRQETQGGGRGELIIGLLVTVAGAALLAVAPGLAPAETRWAFAPDGRFTLLIALVTLPVVVRSLRALSDPRPERIQQVVRVGIMNLIPFSAAIAMLAGGLGWALSIFALALLAVLTAARFRVT